MQPSLPIRAFTLILILIIPPILLLGSIRLLLTEAYLHVAYALPDFPPDEFGFTREDRRTYAPFAVQYLVNGESIDYLRQLTFPDSTPFYNERELSHMADVKMVVHMTLIALPVLLLIGIVSSLILRGSEVGRRALRRGMLGGGLLLIALLLSLVTYILIDWNNFFDSFHDLFFARGTWRFYNSDSLIRLFPIRFWQDAALTVAGLSVVGAFMLILLSLFWGRRARTHLQTTATI